MWGKEISDAVTWKQRNEEKERKNFELLDANVENFHRCDLNDSIFERGMGSLLCVREEQRTKITKVWFSI